MAMLKEEFYWTYSKIWYLPFFSTWNTGFLLEIISTETNKEPEILFENKKERKITKVK